MAAAPSSAMVPPGSEGDGVGRGRAVCRNGPCCPWAARGRCFFTHSAPLAAAASRLASPSEASEVKELRDIVDELIGAVARLLGERACVRCTRIAGGSRPAEPAQAPGSEGPRATRPCCGLPGLALPRLGAASPHDQHKGLPAPPAVHEILLGLPQEGYSSCQDKGLQAPLVDGVHKLDFSPENSSGEGTTEEDVEVTLAREDFFHEPKITQKKRRKKRGAKQVVEVPTPAIEVEPAQMPKEEVMLVPTAVDHLHMTSDDAESDGMPDGTESDDIPKDPDEVDTESDGIPKDPDEHQHIGQMLAKHLAEQEEAGEEISMDDLTAYYLEAVEDEIKSEAQLDALTLLGRSIATKVMGRAKRAKDMEAAYHRVLQMFGESSDVAALAAQARDEARAEAEFMSET